MSCVTLRPKIARIVPVASDLIRKFSSYTLRLLNYGSPTKEANRMDCNLPITTYRIYRVFCERSPQMTTTAYYVICRRQCLTGWGRRRGVNCRKNAASAQNTTCKQTHLGLFIGRLTGVKLCTPVISFIAPVVIVCSPQSEFSTADCFVISLDSPSSPSASFANL